jgi:hypothetical protein
MRLTGRDAKLKGQSETALVKACLALLKLRGVPAWRNNTGAMRATYKGKARLIRFGAPGASDILAILPPHGRLWAIECKVGRNQPTDDQAAFLANVRAAGGVAILIRSVDELAEAMRVLG